MNYFLDPLYSDIKKKWKKKLKKKKKKWGYVHVSMEHWVVWANK